MPRQIKVDGRTIYIDDNGKQWYGRDGRHDDGLFFNAVPESEDGVPGPAGPVAPPQQTASPGSGYEEYVRGLNLGKVDLDDSFEASERGELLDGLFPDEAAYYDRAIDRQDQAFSNISDRLAPYVEAGPEAFAELQRASTIEGLDSRLRDIYSSRSFSAAIDQARNEAASSAAAAGLSRSAAGIQALSRLPLDQALQIEQALYGRTGAIADAGLVTTGTLNQAESNAAGIVSQILTGAGASVSNTGLTREGFDNNIDLQQLSNQGALNRQRLANQGALQQQHLSNQGALSIAQINAEAAHAGLANDLQIAQLNNESADERQEAARRANEPSTADKALGIISTGLSIAAVFGFSDSLLKEDIEKIGERNDLGWYRWKWIDEAPDFVKQQPRVGFMAEEVKERYPNLVKVISGYMAINYEEALKAA